MRPRIVILSVLEPLGEQGLAAEVCDAVEAGVDVVPIATAVLDGGRLRRTPARTIEAALRGAFEVEVDGMLVGALEGYWQSRALARVLETAIPATLVFAPVGPGNVRPAGRAWSIQSRVVLPIATIVVIPERSARALMAGGRDASAQESANAVVDGGAHSAWITCDDDSRRRVDVVAAGGQTSVIDYPSPPGPVGSPAGSLAALLALGLPLREAIERAHRGARNLGDRAFIGHARGA